MRAGTFLIPPKQAFQIRQRRKSLKCQRGDFFRREDIANLVPTMIALVQILESEVKRGSVASFRRLLIIHDWVFRPTSPSPNPSESRNNYAFASFSRRITASCTFRDAHHSYGPSPWTGRLLDQLFNFFSRAA